MEENTAKAVANCGDRTKRERLSFVVIDGLEQQQDGIMIDAGNHLDLPKSFMWFGVALFVQGS